MAKKPNARNGKGSSDRVRKRASFHKSHEGAYGRHEKQDGRRTLVRFDTSGNRVEVKPKSRAFVGADVGADDINATVVMCDQRALGSAADCFE